MVRTILNNAGPHVTHKTRPDEGAVGEHLKKNERQRRNHRSYRPR